MPRRWVLVARVCEHGDAHRLAVHVAGIIAPRGDVAPTLFLARLALGVANDTLRVLELLAVTVLVLDEQLVADADAERAFLRVAEDQRAD